MLGVEVNKDRLGLVKCFMFKAALQGSPISEWGQSNNKSMMLI